MWNETTPTGQTFHLKFSASLKFCSQYRTHMAHIRLHGCSIKWRRSNWPSTGYQNVAFKVPSASFFHAQNQLKSLAAGPRTMLPRSHIVDWGGGTPPPQTPPLHPYATAIKFHIIMIIIVSSWHSIQVKMSAACASHTVLFVVIPQRFYVWVMNTYRLLARWVEQLTIGSIETVVYKYCLL